MSSYNQFSRFFLFLLLSLLAAACTRPAAVGTVDGSEIVAELDAIQHTHGIPAVAAIVVRSDTVLQGAAVGVRSLGDTGQITLRDVFQLGSLTKAITATTIASLVEEGKLSWESRPEDVFPEWKDDIHPALREITLDQMLRHASGLTGYLEEGAPEVETLPQFPDDPVAERQAFARYTVQHAPLFTPGSRRKYSNAGYAIAAAMAEKVSGLAWEALVTERIFSPLGMHSATFGVPPSAEPARVQGHVHKNDSLVPLAPSAMQQAAWLHPAENVWLSLIDYARFLQEHLKGLRGMDGILKSATIQYLHEPMGIDPEALGWDVEKSGELKRSTHGEGRNGFYTAVLLQAEGNIAVAVFGNSRRETDEEAFNELLIRLLNKYIEPPQATP